jgi:hypothetical protein
MDTASPQESVLVPALFSDREHAEMAVNQLREFGVANEDIGVAAAAPGSYQRRDPSDREVVETLGKGAAAGASLGSIAGMSLFGLLTGEAIALTVGGLLLAGTGGLFWGATLGGLVGVITRVRRRTDTDSWSEVQLDGTDVLVVVRVRDWSQEPKIAERLEQAGARAVLDQLALDKDWHELELEHHSGQPAPVASE